jgi:hypothetical protein
MKEAPKSVEEFFEDTLMYYMEDPERRNYSGIVGCKYSPETTKNENSEGCAIGRYLDPEHAKIIDQKNPDNIGIKNLIEVYPQYIPEWMKSFDVHFLKQVQDLHDESFNWSVNKGLTFTGICKVQEITKNFNLNLSDKIKEYVYSRTNRTL